MISNTKILSKLSKREQVDVTLYVLEKGLDFRQILTKLANQYEIKASASETLKTSGCSDLPDKPTAK